MQLLQMFHILNGGRSVTGAETWRFPSVCLALILVLFPPVSACAQSEDGSRTTRRAIAQSQAISSDFLRTELALSPETASRMGMEQLLGPTAVFALDNHSQAGFERRRLVRIELLQRLERRPRLPEDHLLRRDLAVAERALRDLIALEQFGYGRFSYAALRPYAIDPYSGIWIEGPVQLAFRQTVNNLNDAQAYLARLQGLSAALNDTKRRLLADHASGVLLPRHLAERTRDNLAIMVSEESGALQRLADTFIALTSSVPDLDPQVRAQMIAFVETEIERSLRPAYLDMISTLDELSESTSEQAGLWAQPRGRDLYALIMTASVGEDVSLDRLHARHLEDLDSQREAFQARMTVYAEGLDAMPAPPVEIAGQLVWLQDVERALEENSPSNDTPDDALTPPQTLTQFAPKTAWERLARTSPYSAQSQSLRRFQSLWQTQPYLTWRTDGDGVLSAKRRMTEYPAIVAGWQSYIWETYTSETVNAETIEAAHVGLVRTALAATDTGLHLERWSIEEATTFLQAMTGLSPTLAEDLALSIAARPGHHASIAMSVNRFRALSERSNAVLGALYSEQDYQRTLIQPGPRPLPFIEQDVETWYGERLSN
ncbi:MAG: DUF885 family protein [Pseudomonadota bacterium]